MDWQDAHRRLLKGLYGEVRGCWGHISEIEERLGLSGGYLNKLCQGKHEFKLTSFLKTIAAVGLDPATFFSRTLEIHPETGDYLLQLEVPREYDRAFDRIARATLDLESAEPPDRRRATAEASSVAELASCPLTEQRRRLRSTLKYRTHAFARAYLEHLDALRCDHAREAAALATEVAVHLIPKLPGPRGERLSLQCLTLGVFGSARRLEAELGVAARAFRMALELSRRERLLEDSANLLLRASYVLRDLGHFNRALALLNEALVAFVQLGDRGDVGRALVDHGMMNCYAGNYEEAVLDLRQALRHLEDTIDKRTRYHLACYQYLACALEHLGELEAAEECLATGTRTFGPEHAADQAKLEWLRGGLALKRGDHLLAEELLRAALKVLAVRQHPGQNALISLDLVSVMLAQDKHQEATEVATSMARLLFAFENNRFAEAAVVELMKAALAGKLSPDIVAEARARIEVCTPRAPRSSPPIARLDQPGWPPPARTS